MAEVHADPKEIERFRTHLANFNREMERMTAQLDGQLRELGNTWQDQQYHKFSEEMRQSIKAFKKYLQGADATLQDLRKKAGHLTAYGGK